jgi:hypothetical protein
MESHNCPESDQEPRKVSNREAERAFVTSASPQNPRVSSELNVKIYVPGDYQAPSQTLILP